MDLKKALSDKEIIDRLKSLSEWKQEDKFLVRVQTFPNYKDALDFVYKVGMTAEAENHHPDVFMNYKRVTVRYWTHTARGITALDFKLAELVEKHVQETYRKKG